MGGENTVFHPTHIFPFGIARFDGNRVVHIGETVYRNRTPDVDEDEDITLHIVPKHTGLTFGHRSSPHSLATYKDFEEAIEMFEETEVLNSTYIHYNYNEQIAKAKIIGVNASDYNSVKTTLADPSFNDFANNAYTAERGYAIRVNPFTAQKEMFIAGTRTQQDWASNLLEAFPHGGKLITNYATFPMRDSADQWRGHATPWRLKAQRYYEDVAFEEGVDIIYGHSRGGAIVADMQVSDDIQKIGLDAAMVIADNKDMVNYYEAGEGAGRGWNWVKSRFDAGIGLTGKNNVHMNLSPKFHSVWADK